VQRASPQCSISLSLKSADSWRKTDTQTKQLLLLRQCLHGRGGQKEVGAMRASSIVGLLFAAVVLAAIPVSPQVTPRGVSLSVDKAQAVTYRRARVTARRVGRREYRHVRRAVLRGAY
jgi:hypothetical protein